MTSRDASLTGCRIVLTRPAEQAEEFATALRRLGATVRVRPLVRIAPPADVAPLSAALARLATYDWIAFTSANAVRVCLREVPAGASWPPVACVGTGTALAAEAGGMSVLLMPEVFSGEALAAALVRTGSVQGRRVLWPRASGARDLFATRLRGAGAEVDDVECYRTLSDQAAAEALATELRHNPADILVFTSPSAVRCFAAAGGMARGGAVAVIGKVTADAAEQAGWEVRVIPPEQSLPGLVAALERWYAGVGG